MLDKSLGMFEYVHVATMVTRDTFVLSKNDGSVTIVAYTGKTEHGSPTLNIVMSKKPNENDV